MNIHKWLVVGHSNGGEAPKPPKPYSLLNLQIGQGTWFIATHRPQEVIAAAPVSGYLSISGKKVFVT